MRSNIALLSVFVAICTRAVCQDPLDSPIEGFFSPADFESKAGQAAAVAAGRTPNATSNVVFKALVDGTEQMFTWRVNITELTLPNDIQTFGQPSATNFSKGLHAANTQWQLEWPQGGSNRSLQSFLSDNRQRTFFISAGINYAPVSITKSWTNPRDGNCSSLLGATCVAELQQLPLKVHNNQTNYSSSNCNKILNTAM